MEVADIIDGSTFHSINTVEKESTTLLAMVMKGQLKMYDSQYEIIVIIKCFV